ncbi:hypothetical protein Tco_0881777 [Tanacetum coccineum]
MAQFLNGFRNKDLICGGMFVTRIDRSFGLLTNAMVDALSVEPRAYVFNKRSLISIAVVMDLGRGTCCWPTTRQVREEDEVEEAAKEGAGGSANVYRNMSRGDWQEITNRIACRKFFKENECEIFTVFGEGVRIFPDGVTSPDL